MPTRTEPQTILVAEDEAGVRQITLRMLEGWGYKLLEASDGVEAVKRAIGHTAPLHLLLTDVRMPQMGGIELARKMAALHPEARTLFISGFADQPEARQSLGSQPNIFLAKPFTGEALKQKVRSVLRVAAPRYGEALPVLYRSQAAPEWQRGRIENLSETGRLLAAAKPVCLETRLELTFELPEWLGRLNSGQVNCIGRVVRHGQPTPSVPYPLGIQFVEVSGPPVGRRSTHTSHQ